MIRKITAAFIGTLFLSALNTQQSAGIIEIDNQAIMDTLYEAVPRMAAACPDAGLASLQRHISAGFSSATSYSSADFFSARTVKAFSGAESSTAPLTPAEIYAKRIKGVLMFGNYYDCGECDNLHVGIGATATVLTSDGICLTNYHVMEDIIKNDTAALSGDSLFYIGTVEGKVYPVTDILAYSRLGDLAVFRVDTRGDRLEAIPLGTSLPAGSRVHVIGHPKQQFYYYPQGVVARNSKHTYSEGVTMRQMQITADFAVGASGGPILDNCGNLVGMVASTTALYFDDEEKANQQMVVKCTIPVSMIKELLKLPSVTAEIQK